MFIFLFHVYATTCKSLKIGLTKLTLNFYEEQIKTK